MNMTLAASQPRLIPRLSAFLTSVDLEQHSLNFYHYSMDHSVLFSPLC